MRSWRALSETKESSQQMNAKKKERDQMQHTRMTNVFEERNTNQSQALWEVKPKPEYRKKKQIFYTTDEGETEEQYWETKEAIRRNHASAGPTMIMQSVSTNLIKQQPEIQIRLRKTNQIIVKQSKDAVSQQFKAKLLQKDHSECMLQHDGR